MQVKKCAECGRNFKPPRWNIKFCGDECRDKYTKRRHNANNARWNAANKRSSAPSMQEKVCPICGDPFMPKSPNQSSCDKFPCRRAVGGCACRDSIEKCAVCGKDYEVKKGSYRQVCRDRDCVRKFNAMTQAKVADTVEEKRENAPAPWKHDMKCPWAGGLFERDTLPHGVKSWDDPIMCFDGRGWTDGVWIETSEIAEVRAA